MAKDIVSVARQYLGVPYVWGGDNAHGLDCSGFLQNVYRQMGVSLPRTTFDQIKAGRPVTLQGLRPGDAVFTVPSSAGPDHVGLYVGHGMIQESPHTGTVNSLIPLKSFLGDGFVGARRYIGGLKGGQVYGPAQPGRSGPVGNTAGAVSTAQNIAASGNPLAAMQLIQGVLGRGINSNPVTPQVNPLQVQAALPSINPQAVKYGGNA